MKKTDKKHTFCPPKVSGKALPPISPKRKGRKISLALIAVVMFLLVAILAISHRPAAFDPPTAQAKQISPYLTHELLPTFYDHIQRAEPFELEITENGMNEIITHLGWPKNFKELTIDTPQTLFTDNVITLMAPVSSNAAQILLTICLCPAVDDNGLMTLKMEKVQIGAVTITPLAKFISNKMYQDRLDKESVDANDIRAKIAASLFADTSFDPVFKFDNNRFRIKKIAIGLHKTILGIEPLTDN
ncbi:MAG: hypothetical protein PHF37_01755 [Phycisphaerae bacterium]|nr:hypothetical protein [Phycisphaerae bacterium]